MTDEPSSTDAAAWIRSEYQRLATTTSDINQHLHTLREIASTRRTILECGTRHAVSTVGFVAGLLEMLERTPYGGSSLMPQVWCLDIDRKPEVDNLAMAAELCNIHIEYGDHDTTKSLRRGPKLFDVAFIDTWHVEEQLRAELNWVPKRVKPGGLLLLHDTITYWEEGETKGHRGLRYALEPWMKLEENEDWYIVRHDAYNNGLLILERRDAH